MRKTSLRMIPALSFALLAASGARADSVRTLKVELSGAEASHFAVENLVGRLRVSPGTGSSVEIIATVYGENDELAGAVRLERIPGEGATVRVRYPYDRIKTFRYRAPSDHDSGFWGGDWSSADQVEYDGRRVSVSHRHGTALYADLDVRIPASRVQARFVQKVGLIEAEHLQGDLAFAVASADLRLRALEGSLHVEGSSGDVHARDVKGSWTSDFTSGDCDLVGFEGDALTIRTTSGDASLRSVKARRAELESTSGDFRLVDADLQELSAEANSGDIAFEAAGTSLREARIRTASGDVSLRLPSESSFDVEADQSSGDMDVRFSDGSVVNHRDRIVGYRHGDGGAHIRVRTSSGDLTVSPS